MTLEVKLRTLARQDPTLQTLFFDNNKIRWFDVREQPGYIQYGTCVRVRRISTVRSYAHETRTARSVMSLARPRVQIDVLDYDPERARSAAAAIRDWLGRVDFSSDAQFGSPTTSPTHHPNFVLNELTGMLPDTDPPVYTVTLDVRITDLEEE